MKGTQLSEIKDLFPTKILEATMPGYDKAYSTQRFMNFMDTAPGWLNYPSEDLRVNEDPTAPRNSVDVGKNFRKGISGPSTAFSSAMTDYGDPAVWDWIHLKLKEYAIAEGMGSSSKPDGSANTSDDDKLYGWANTYANGPISGPDVISFWCNISYHNSQLLAHHHCYSKVNMGGFAGVFYVDAIPEQGRIGFEHPMDPFITTRYAQGWGQVNYANRQHAVRSDIDFRPQTLPYQHVEFDPAPGKLLLFPAYLKHYVICHNTHTPRLNIAFEALFSYK